MTTAAILTVGDELLAGDIDNTNATWLAHNLTERGVDVREIRVVHDDTEDIATAITDLTRYDTTIVTGGLGSTPDDLTLAGIAEALDQQLIEHEDVRRELEPKIAERMEHRTNFNFDMDAATMYPEHAEIIPNDIGIAPGCRVEHVYVVPGIPREMKAVFGRVVDRFNGALRSTVLYSSVPESNLSPILDDVQSAYDVRIGCYPGGEFKRIKVSGESRAAVDATYEELLQRPEIVREPDGE